MRNLMMVVVVLLVSSGIASAATLVDLRYSSGRNVPWTSYAQALYMYEDWDLDIVEIEGECYKELDLGVARTMFAENGWTFTGEVYHARATGGQQYWIPTGIVSYDRGQWHGSLVYLNYRASNSASFGQDWLYFEAFKRLKGFDLGISSEHTRLHCEPAVAIDKWGLAIQRPVGKYTTGELRLAQVDHAGLEWRVRLISLF